MRYRYSTNNTCSSQIAFDLDGDVVHNIEFTGGCNGNLKAIQKRMFVVVVLQFGSADGGSL